MHVYGGWVTALGGHARLACLQQRKEGGHAHARRHPHLLAAARALAIKAAVGPFDVYALTGAQALVKGAGVVAQRLDHQTQQGLSVGAVAQRVRCTGNGERVGTFGSIKTHEDELPRAVPAPAGRHGANDLDRRTRGRIAQHGDCLDARRMVARAPHPARQRPHGGQAAQCQQRAHQQAQRQRPERERHQRHGMEHQREEQHRHGAVQEAPVFIGQQACNQRERHHGQQQVEGPLAQVLGKTAGIRQPGQHGLARGPAGTAPQGLDPATRLLGAPVGDGGEGGGDTRPFVQAVDLVHAAHHPVQQRQAQGEQHDQRHQADAPQPTQVHRVLAQLPPAQGDALRIDQGRDTQVGRCDGHPCQGNAQQPDSQYNFDTHEEVLLFSFRTIVKNPP